MNCFVELPRVIGTNKSKIDDKGKFQGMITTYVDMPNVAVNTALVSRVDALADKAEWSVLTILDGAEVGELIVPLSRLEVTDKLNERIIQTIQIGVANALTLCGVGSAL
jgi:hypothetical protein